MRRVLVVAGVIAAMAAPLSAELKYTMKAELKPSTGPAAPANPMFDMIGGQIVQQLLPTGAAEVVYLVGDRGMRAEYKQGMMGTPAGSVVLVRPTGEIVAIDPAAKTYWKMTPADVAKVMAMMPIKPVATSKRTGEFAPVAGVRTERMSFEIRIDLPIPPEALAQMPPGFPTSIVMSGDAWIADQYKNYAKVVALGASGMGGMGMDKIMSEGLMLKQVMRSDFFGGKQFELTATQIGEEAADAALFEIPAGLKEVPSPAAGIGGGGTR